MHQAKLSSKYQLSIPKALREELNLKSGQQFTLLAKGNIIELVPAVSVDKSRGLIAGLIKESTPMDYRDRSGRE